MKIDITEKVKIPEEVTIDIGKDKIKVKGPKGSNEKKLFHPKIKIEKKNKLYRFSPANLNRSWKNQQQKLKLSSFQI